MRASIIILFLVAVILLSVTGLIQNLPMIYADNLENQSLQVSSVTKSSTSSPPNVAQQQEQLQQTQQPLQQQQQQRPQNRSARKETIFNTNNKDKERTTKSNPRTSNKLTS